MTYPDRESMPYRACVGVMLLNTQGRVWIGRRIPKWHGDQSARLWQMPQGGIDEGETPEEAALRELAEETGASRGTVVGRTQDWLHYDLPDDALGVALKGRYRGQKQHWFAIRFEGSDDDFNINPADHKPEFDQWRWEDIDNLPGLVVPFKRPVYEELVRLFKPLTRSG
ncbi:MAG: RNA pyrophosphohydrolase [Pseudomonadota bacterium]